MIKEFKTFILRGNVLDLAVGVIIGAAFTAIVKSFVDHLVNPLIGIFLHKGALSRLSFHVLNATFGYGAFLNDVLNFLITAFVIFLLIKFINKIFPRKEETPAVNEELETLKEIRNLLQKNSAEKS